MNGVLSSMRLATSLLIIDALNLYFWPEVLFVLLNCKYIDPMSVLVLCSALSFLYTVRDLNLTHVKF